MGDIHVRAADARCDGGRSARALQSIVPVAASCAAAFPAASAYTTASSSSSSAFTSGSSRGARIDTNIVCRYCEHMCTEAVQR